MRKVKYLVAALLLMGATTTFTSCIDNDEPAGITELRGAKAELLKAKAVVEQANASMILAQAEYQKALAAHEQANADYRQAEVEMQKLLNELQAAQNEAEKAKLEAEIANYKNQMEEAALAHQTEMVRLQGVFAEQQRQYELILKQIKIAQELGSDQEKVDLVYLQNQVDLYYAQLFGGTYLRADALYAVAENPDNYLGLAEDGSPIIVDGGTKIELVAGRDYVTVVGEVPENGVLAAGVTYSWSVQVYVAEKNLYEATLEKSYGFGGDNDELDNKQWVPYLEVQVEKKQYDVDAKTEALKKLQEFLATDVTTADWRQEIEDLKAEIDELKVAKSQKDVDVDNAYASDSYIAAAEAYLGVKVTTVDGEEQVDYGDANDSYPYESTAKEDGYKVLGTAQKKNITKNKLDAALIKDVEGVTVKEFEVETTDAVLGYVNDAALAAWVAEGNEEAKFVPYKDFKLAEVKLGGQFTVNTTTNAVVLADKKQLKDNVDAIADWVEYAGKASASANDAETAKMLLESLEKAEKEAEENYEEALVVWKNSMSAYKGELLPVPTTDVEAAAKVYATALSTLSSSIESYNKAYKDAYDEAFDASVEEQKSKAYNDSYLPALIDLGKTCSLPGYNQTNAQKELARLQPGSALYTVANATTIIEGSIEKDATAEQIAEIKKATFTKADTQARAAAAADYELNKESYEAAAKTAGQTAGDKAVKDIEESITKAKTGAIAVVTDAYDALYKALYSTVAKDASFFYTAKTYYGQVAADDAVSLLLATQVDKNKDIVDFCKSDTKDGYKVYTILRSDLTADEIKSVTKTKLGENGEPKAAWKNGSEYAFGVWEDLRAVAPTEPEMRKQFTNLEDGGAYGAYLAAQDAVQEQKDKIAAGDDLKQLVTDLTQLQSDYNEAIETAKTEAYGKEITAFDEAVAANKTAKATYDAENVKVEKVTIESYKLQVEIDALNDALAELQSAVMEHLGIKDDEDKGFDYTDAEAFEDALNNAVLDMKEKVAIAEQALAKAKAALQEAQEGKYDDVAEAQRNLDYVSAEYARVEALYNQATANLAKALEIMAETAE